MIPADFANTGLHIRGNGTIPTRFQVLGERSSGTNYVKRLLGKNTKLKPTEALGWKHAHSHARPVPEDLALICVVRHAVPWMLSMHAKPWHCTPAMQALAFPDFIRAPWDTIFDRSRYFNVPTRVIGRPLKPDLDPATGAPYPDLIALREGKLRSLLARGETGCSFVLLRMEEAVARPAEILQAICAGLDLPPPRSPMRRVVNRLGAKFLPAIPDRPATPKTLPPQDLEWLRSRLDLQQEAALGYSYD